MFERKIKLNVTERVRMVECYHEEDSVAHFVVLAGVNKITRN